MLHYSPKPVQTEMLWLLSPHAAFRVHEISLTHPGLLHAEGGG